MDYELSIQDTPTSILKKVEQYLLDAMDLVEQRPEEVPVIAAYDAFRAAKQRLS